ncbi:MAG: hypothetical protein ABI810_21895 [Sphingomonas bacterium]
MLGQIVAAQFELETVIGELSRSGAGSAALLDSQSQLGALNALRKQVGSTGGSSLAAMRSEIASAISASQSTTQQARTSAAGKADVAELIKRAQEAREQVDAVMRGMKDFEPYLKFASPEDEAEYRKREAERRALIEAEEAKGTAQGDLNASNVALRQLVDAKAHGADRSPLFASRLTALTNARDHLEGAQANATETQHNTVDSSPTLARARADEASSSPSDLGDAMAALKAAGVTKDEIAFDSGPDGKPLMSTAALKATTTSGRA